MTIQGFGRVNRVDQISKVNGQLNSQRKAPSFSGLIYRIAIQWRGSYPFDALPTGALSRFRENMKR